MPYLASRGAALARGKPLAENAVTGRSERNALHSAAKKARFFEHPLEQIRCGAW